MAEAPPLAARLREGGGGARIRIRVQSPLGAHLEFIINPDDIVYLLKCKIFRIRGIPVSHQHLTHNLIELSNSSSLRSHSIGEGSVLELIVSPTNGLASDCGRNVSALDSIQWTDVKHYLRDDPMEWLQASCHGLIVDDDNEDPIGIGLGKDQPPAMFLPGIPLTEEDCVTKCKMIDVQSRMRELSLKRHERNGAVRRGGRDESLPSLSCGESCPCGEGDHSESLYSGLMDFYRHPASRFGYESKIRKLPNKNYRKANAEERITPIEEDETFPPDPTGDPKEAPQRGFLPPIESKVKEKSKRTSIGKTERARCSVCRKKLSIATVHVCQCGGAYCAPHRYSEAHNCNYDYSKEWQAQLHRANPPAFSIPKLPKI